MKRILCLIDSLGPGGAQRQLVGLSSFLKEKGYDVSVACYHDNRFYEEQLVSNGVPYVYLQKAENPLFRICHIARYIRKFKPNVVIAYLETPSVCACTTRLFNQRFKLIVSERNTTQQTGRNEKIRFNLFRLADYVVPNAFAQENYITKTFPFLSKKVVVIPNFVDLEKFVPPVKRERRSIPEIMIAASIWESKNTMGFIDAVALLKDEGYKFHVSWFGKDARNIGYFDACQERIKEKEVSQYISLLDKTNAIDDRYREADYFCLPSFYEGTPNVICEAMASGLPILCSDVCDNSRFVSEGENGCLFDPHDVNSITTSIKRLLSLDENDYQVFCHKSRIRAEALLSKEMFVQSYIRIIENENN